MGRYINGIRSLDEVNTLLKYLYLSEDHFVEFEDAMHIRFKLWMKDDSTLVRKMLNGFTDMEFTSDNFNHKLLMGIIAQLKKQPASEFPDNFENRWEELKEMTMANLALNEMHQLRMT